MEIPMAMVFETWLRMFFSDRDHRKDAEKWDDTLPLGTIADSDEGLLIQAEWHATGPRPIRTLFWYTLNY